AGAGGLPGRARLTPETSVPMMPPSKFGLPAPTTQEAAIMKRRALLATVLLVWSGTAGAAEVPGRTADERAINGARAYMKAHGLTSLKLNMLTSPFHTKALAREIPIFEKATGIGLGDLIEVGILQIQAKAMAEAVARSGSFD